MGEPWDGDYTMGLPVEREAPAGVIATHCGTCRQPMLIATDKDYAPKTVHLEATPRRTGQFIISHGLACWWGPTGAPYRKHQCPVVSQ